MTTLHFIKTHLQELDIQIRDLDTKIKAALINEPLKPLVKWSGGKGDEIEEILKYMPDSYDTYIEPFIGGGALFFHINPKKAVINDIHPELVKLYRAVGSGDAPAIKAFMLAHPNKEDEYYKVRDLVPINDVEAAARFYYLRKTCFRGMLRYNSQGKFNIPYGKYATINSEDLDNSDYQDLLGRTTVLNGDFMNLFTSYNSPNNFMFLDPPYDSVFTDYGYCTFGRPEQERLAAAFKATQIKCLMVIGETDYIKELYKDYIVARYPKKYKFKIHSGRVGEEINVQHLVIKNY